MWETGKLRAEAARALGYSSPDDVPPDRSLYELGMDSLVAAELASSLQKQIRKLEDMSSSQRRFVSDVSHELRTPLTTVRMAGDVLHDARERFDPVTARAAELLQAELDRFESLLTDLLEISRFDAGAARLDLEDVNLADVAHRVVDSTRALAEARGTHVVVRTGPRPCVAATSVSCRIVRSVIGTGGRLSLNGCQLPPSS